MNGDFYENCALPETNHRVGKCVCIALLIFVTNVGSVQFVQAALGNIIRVSVASDGA